MRSSYLFTSERLGFRDWNDSDSDFFSGMNADPVVMEYFPKCLSKNESNSFMGKIRNHFESYGYGLFAVEILNASELIGFIGFQNTHFKASFTPCIEIGWRLIPRHWGNGYATEGALRCIQFGFCDLEMRNIASFTSEVNVRSINVMKRIGMRFRQRFIHPAIDSDSCLAPHVLYTLNRVDWSANEGD